MNDMITSIQNARVRKWRKLHTRKGRRQTQTFLVEGFHLIEEAWKSNWIIDQLIVQGTVQIPNWMRKLPIVRVSSQVFHAISQTEAPQGIAAVIQMKTLPFYPTNHTLLLDAIQDPGNVGTMIRTADAAGFSAVFLGKGTVDLYNDKVIRATQGSLFHIPIIQSDLMDTLTMLKDKNYSIWAADVGETSSFYHQLKAPQKVALMLGNEGSGIDTDLIQEAHKIVKIPIYGEAESLNVSIAAGILMYYLQM